MAVKTKCSTPGAMFTTHIQPTSITTIVHLPKSFDLNKVDAIQLERTVHNAMELALAPLFARTEKHICMPQV